MAGPTFARQAGNLPADQTSFVGRRQELAEIRRLQSVSRLVTLTGVGGVGKTRLARRAAAQQYRAYDAVWLVDLASLTDPALVLQTVAATIGLRDDHSEAAPLQALTDFLASKRTLLVLDNCEHLLDACAGLAGHLLRAVPTLRILATSRQSLGIAGEQQLSVAPLSVPEPDQALTPRALQLFDAVTLLVDRATTVTPGFCVDEDNQRDVARLCRHLDGIPLAIELAAVQLRTLSVGRLAEHLSQRYRLLTGGHGAAVPRHRTLHALIDWSVQLLSPAEQALWSRMSIFPGHVDLEAVEAVCAGDGIEQEDVVDLIDALLDKSLLLREEHAGQARYRMLETIREFGQMHLTEPERRSLLYRHRDWNAHLAEQAAAKWYGPEQAAWFTRLRLAHAHLRAAMDFCLTEPGQAEIGLRMATDLHRPHWLANAFYNEGRHWLGRMLHANPAPTTTRGRALCADALLAYLLGDFAAGRPLIAEARALADQLDDPPYMAQIHMVCGFGAHWQNDHAQAATLLEKAVAQYTAVGDEFGVVLTLPVFAAVLGCLGQETRAKEPFERALTLTHRAGDSWCRAWALISFAFHMWNHGDNERAIHAARESLLVGHALNDRQNMTSAIEILALALAGQGHREDAARMLGAAEAVGRSAGITPFVLLPRRQHQCVDALKNSLGGQAFTRALRQGCRLTVEQAIAEAVGARTEGGPDILAAVTASSPLTAREREVAELAAQGMSNKQIAATLVIAPRTAKAHVEHIMTKLGVNSRTQVAIWMIAQKASKEDTP
ncbi:LuxR C-terminal-related transcriptional regulator [Actinoallomurus purpureus]|uniref:ATP-binding protein n=1 Tax=Actinoallomurus purpureus TaxID=478114 RepID=UPI0020932A4E|nr:LuxR C-terminal-related transcriptional regulator [Actinoallomurus purpureus]MCO6008118.1 LuxR C-terminal-related transcriptional regulator [Actinoallomurus purpureus]